MTVREKIINPNFASAFLIVIIGLIFTAQMVNKPLSDWGNYYYGSSFLLSGMFNKDVYEPYKFNLMVRGQGETDIFLNYTPIPPFSALFYLPFQFTNALNSKIIFCLLSTLIFAWSFFRFTKFLGINSYWLVVIPIALALPLRANIFFGQTYLLVCAMLMEGFVSYKSGRGYLAAFLWSAAILLKLFPGIVLLYLLFKKDFRQLGITLGVMLVISLITAAVTGFGLNLDYFTQIMPRMLNNEINDTYASSYQSMHVLLNKIFVYDKLLNPAGTVNNPLLFKILNSFYSLAVLYICAMFTLKGDSEDYIKFSMWILAGLLITGYGSGYSLLLLNFIAAASVKYLDKKTIALTAVFGLILVISSVPVHWFSRLSVLMQFPRLYLLIVFFILIMLLFKIKPALKYSFIVPVLAVIWGYVSAQQPNNSTDYVLDKEEALLIYDYGSSNGKLKIMFIDQNGKNEKELRQEADFSVPQSTELKDNQIYYNGRQLTFSGDNKLKPMITAGEEIYYLSDKNRGVGFYTLRKIVP